MPSFEKDLPSGQSAMSPDQINEIKDALAALGDRIVEKIEDVIAAIKSRDDQGNDVADGPDAKA